MSGELIQFGFEGNEVRVHVDDAGDPWFVASDVCIALEISNVGNVIARLDLDEKGIRRMDTLGGMQDISIVNESGLYRLIFRSNKPEAKRFQKWVFSEVLPSIRKTGSYSIIEEPTQKLRAPYAEKYDEIVGTLDAYKSLAEFFKTPPHIMMIEANKELGRIGIDATPFLLSSPAMENIQLTEEYLEPTELGRRWKMSGAEMNKTLESLGLQARVNKEWIPTDKAHGMYTKHAWAVKSKSGYNLKWNVAKVEAMMTNHQLGILSPDLMIGDDDLILDDDSM